MPRSHYRLNPDYHENWYFHSSTSMASALRDAATFVESVEVAGGQVTALSTAIYVDDDGETPLNQVYVTVVR